MISTSIRPARRIVHLSWFPILLILAAPATLGAQSSPTSRDWRTWPFSELSPWNQPIGSGARYAGVSRLASYRASINHDDRWTSSVVIATDQDPDVRMLFGPGWGPLSHWKFLDRGGKNCGNSRSTELTLLRSARPELPFEANYYSTTHARNDRLWQLPANYHHASQDYFGTFHLPRGVCPSPDSDGFLAVFQPDGWVIDIYAAVVTSSGEVIGTMASYIDARGDGTGWWSGRRASMLPSFAGLIRNGEIASGRIPHALAALAPASLLKRQAVWPAYAFDRDSGYSGTLPMGTLLAIPSNVDLNRIGLSPQGKVIAKAAQGYGVYVVDRGGSGITFLAELGNTEIRWDGTRSSPPSWRDIETIKNLLQRVTNNTPSTPGGGGVPRAPLAPPLTN